MTTTELILCCAELTAGSTTATNEDSLIAARQWDVHFTAFISFINDRDADTQDNLVAVGESSMGDTSRKDARKSNKEGSLDKWKDLKPSYAVSLSTYAGTEGQEAGWKEGERRFLAYHSDTPDNSPVKFTERRWDDGELGWFTRQVASKEYRCAKHDRRYEVKFLKA